jgi:hypothetical protein
MKLNDYIAVQKNTEGILGKMMYYSVSNILIDREEFQRIGRDFGLPKIKPARESPSDAFSKATSALYERIVVNNGNSATAYRIYCRKNMKTAKDSVSCELVKEEMCESTNHYKKLMNIEFDKSTENIRFCNKEYDCDIDLDTFCDKMLRLYQLYRTCYNSTHVETVLESLLESMQANKISIRGRIFFVPKQNLNWVSLFEDFIGAISAKNSNIGNATCNSMFVVDDEKQRLKMKERRKFQGCNRPLDEKNRGFESEKSGLRRSPETGIKRHGGRFRRLERASSRADDSLGEPLSDGFRRLQNGGVTKFGTVGIIRKAVQFELTQ